MPFKVVKYAVSGSFTGADRKGDWLVGQSDSVAYGPTSVTGFWAAYEKPPNGYVLYLDKASSGPSIYSFSSGTDLLNFCNTYLGAGQTSVSGVLTWLEDDNEYLLDPLVPAYIFVGAFTLRAGSGVNHIAKNSLTNVLDTGYRTNTGTAFNGQVIGVKKYSNDKLLCVGVFTSFNGVSRNRICRLNADGTLDTTFNPGTGLNSAGHQINVDESTGYVYASGTFTSYNGVSVGRFIRILDDGTLDSSFSTNSSLNNYAWGIDIDADHVYIAGAFTTVGGTSCLRLAKLNKTTGALVSPTGVGLNNTPWPVKTDPSNSNFLIVGGNDGFTSFNGVTVKSRIVRVNKTTWAADATFNGNVSAFGARVSSLDFDDSNKIILGGSFSNYNSTGRNFFLKLNSNGTLDTTFNPTNPNLAIRGAVFYPVSKKIGIHGVFTNYAGSGAARGAVVDASTGLVDLNFNSAYTGGTQDNWTSVEVTSKVY